MLDPAGAEMLALFGEWFYTKFGSPEKFVRAIDCVNEKDGNGRINKVNDFQLIIIPFILYNYLF